MAETIRLIAFPGAPNLPVFLGIEDGHFERHGVRVELTTTPSSTFQFEALADGRLKAGGTLLTCAFGAGLTSAAMLIRWGQRVTPLERSDVELPPCEQSGRELVQRAVEHFCDRDN